MGGCGDLSSGSCASFPARRGRWQIRVDPKLKKITGELKARSKCGLEPDAHSRNRTGAFLIAGAGYGFVRR